jgi:hypothetical protein
MYRIAFVTGTLLGLAEAARRLDARGDAVATTPAAVAPTRVRVAPARPRRAPKPKARPVPVLADRNFDWFAQRLAFVLLPIAIGFFVWLVFAGAKTDASAPFPTRPAPARPSPRERPPTAAPAVVKPKPVSLVLEDVRTDSWVEVRQGSPTGTLVYSGVLRNGDRVALKGTRLWARFGGAGDLQITANGRVVSLQGTVDTVFTAGGASQ